MFIPSLPCVIAAAANSVELCGRGDGMLAILVAVPASFTRLLHTPITVSDIGSWSTPKDGLGNYSIEECMVMVRVCDDTFEKKITKKEKKRSYRDLNSDYQIQSLKC